MADDIEVIPQDLISKRDSGSFVVPDKFFVEHTQDDIRRAWRVLEATAAANPSYEFWVETTTGFNSGTIISWRKRIDAGH